MLDAQCLAKLLFELAPEAALKAYEEGPASETLHTKRH
jgi:hypothetical protein